MCAGMEGMNLNNFENIHFKYRKCYLYTNNYELE